MMLRILAYKALTQAIIWLGLLRQKTMPHKGIVPRPLQMVALGNRVFDLLETESWVCCDCGLGHMSDWFGPDVDCGHENPHLRYGFRVVGHFRPVRPRAYDYSWRKGAPPSSLAVPRKDDA